MFIKNGSFKNITHIISYVPPFITVQLLSGTAFSGQDYTFKIKVRGSKPITYQWYKNNFPLINKTNSELLIEDVTSSDQAYYYCKISNNGHYVESNVVPLSVIESPYIVTQPVSVLSAIGSNILLSVSATGTEPLTYEWYKNNLIYQDSTSKNLYINNINYINEGSYYVIVTNEFGSATSLSASVRIIEPLIIRTQPTNLNVNKNNNAQFSLSCTGYFPVSSQWRKDGSLYGDLSSNNNGIITLNINTTKLSDIGYYDCVLSSKYDSVTSEKVYLQVNEKPVFTLNPLSAEIPMTQTVTFMVDASGTDPITYQWIKIGTGNVLNEKTKLYTIQNVVLSDQAEYACVATNLVGSTTSLYAALSITQQELILSDSNPYEFILLDQNVYWSF